MLHKKIISILLVLILTTVLFAACGDKQAPGASSTVPTAPSTAPTPGESEPGASAEEASLVFWLVSLDDEQTACIREFSDNYTAKTGVKVDVQVLDNKTLRDTIKPAIMSGSGPDVFRYDCGETLGELARAGLILDMTPYAEAGNWHDELSEYAFTETSFDGKLYAIGASYEIMGAFYNKQIFSENNIEKPTTYAEFLDICKRLKGNGITPVAFGNLEQWPGLHMFTIWSTVFAGKEKIDAFFNGQGSWQDPEFVESMDQFADFVAKGYTNESPNATGYDDVNKIFINGETAMFITGTWQLGHLTDGLGDNVGIFPIPSGSPEIPTMPAGGVGDAYAVSSATAYPNESVAYLKEIFGTEASAVALLERVGYFTPVHLDDSNLSISQLAKDVSLIAEEYDGVSTHLDQLFSSTLNEVVKSVIQELTAGTITGAEACAKIQQAYDEEKAAG